jgi:hypothetical protein
VSFYVDSDAEMTGPADQNICFRPDGTWYSTTFDGWSGRWFQKGTGGAGRGDRVRVLGNYLSGRGSDSGELEFVHLKLLSGLWTEWMGDLSFVNWTRANLNRISRFCPASTVAPNAPEGANPSGFAKLED